MFSKIKQFIEEGIKKNQHEVTKAEEAFQEQDFRIKATKQRMDKWEKETKLIRRK